MMQIRNPRDVYDDFLSYCDGLDKVNALLNADVITILARSPPRLRRILKPFHPPRAGRRGAAVPRDVPRTGL